MSTEEWTGRERAALREAFKDIPQPLSHYGKGDYDALMLPGGVEAISWPGFDSSDLPKAARRPFAAALVALVNNYPQLEAAFGEVEKALADILAQFLPEHLDRVSDTDCGSRARAVLAKYAVPPQREESTR